MKVIFFSLTSDRYSRSWSLHSGIEKLGIDTKFVTLSKKNILNNLKFYQSTIKNSDSRIVIASASQLLVIPVFFTFKKRPYLDAGWSLFESTKANHKRVGRFGQRLLVTYFIDFLASHFSKKIFLESRRQSLWYSRTFLLPNVKCKTIYTSLDEFEFSPRLIENRNPEDQFKIVFRGKDNVEAGLDILARATILLEEDDIKFTIVSKVKDPLIKFSKKTKVINQFFESKNDIATIMANSDLSLGQLSGHSRLNRTIPHKAFESAYLGIPYLTARNIGILEIFNEDEEIFCFDPGSPEDLAKKIRFLNRHRDLLKKSSLAIQLKYRSALSQELMSRQLLSELNLPNNS